MASLSSVRIPKDAVAVLTRVVELDDQHLETLVAGLSSGDVRDMAALKAAVRDAVGDEWDASDVDAFVGHMMSMSALGTSHDFTPVTLAQVITDKIASSLDEHGVAVLPERLAALLEARDFLGFSKAVDISTEYDQLLHVSRIISDVRPVFGADADDDPLGAVIVHSLRIDYFHEGRIKTTSFALNTNDLTQLKAVVERAEKKQRSLSRALERLAMPEFDLSDEADEENR